jgi:hypothetical protein
MSIVEILYVITGVSLIVVTVTVVWLANETIKLVKSLRKSSDDVALMTSEMKEKVLVVTEALDRAGTAATNIIGLIEDAIEGIKEKREQLANSIGLVTGVGEYFKKKKSEKEDSEEEDPKPKKIAEEAKESTKEEDLEHAKPMKKEKIEKPEIEEEEDESGESIEKPAKKK